MRVEYKFVERDDSRKRSVFYKRYNFVAHRWNDTFYNLQHYNFEKDLRLRHSENLPRLELPSRHALDSAAVNFGEVARVVDSERNESGQVRVESRTRAENKSRTVIHDDKLKHKWRSANNPYERGA